MRALRAATDSRRRVQTFEAHAASYIANGDTNLRQGDAAQLMNRDGTMPGDEEPPFAEASDLELVRRSASGDLPAFERLYRSYESRTYALCLRMIGEHAAAEDLTQEVWIRVWEKLAGFRGDSRFSSWLHRLTAHLVLDHIRKNGVREGRIDIVDDPGRLEGVGRSPSAGSGMDL